MEQTVHENKPCVSNQLLELLGVGTSLQRCLLKKKKEKKKGGKKACPALNSFQNKTTFNLFQS